MSDADQKAKAAQRAKAYRERKRAQRDAEEGSEDQAAPLAGTGSDTGADTGTDTGTDNAQKIVPSSPFGAVDVAALPAALEFPSESDEEGQRAGVTVLAPDTAPKKRGRPAKAPTAGKAAGSLTNVKAPKTPTLAKSMSRLAQTGFAMFAGMRGPHWRLSEEEADEIGSAFADVIGALPPSLAQNVTPAIATVAAPIALIGAVSAPVMLRINQERAYFAEQNAQQQQARAQMEAANHVPQHSAQHPPEQKRPEESRQGQENQSPVGPDADGVQSQHVSIFASHQFHAAGSRHDL